MSRPAKDKRQVLRENFVAKMVKLGKSNLRADDLFYMGKAVCEGLVDSEIRKAYRLAQDDFAAGAVEVGG